MEDWPHQERALQIIPAAMAGADRILCAAPTGAGKSRIMLGLLEMSRTATLYTDRRMLLDQIAGQLKADRFEFGVRASGHDESPMQPIQLCMVQTEASRVLQGKSREHHKSELVLKDEAHRHTGGNITELSKRHLADGSKIVGFTATPLDLGEHYDRLIVVATNSDCRKCGAHVPAMTYAPDEPDLHHIKRMKTGDFEPGQMSKMFTRPVIFGRVLSHWMDLNESRPTLLFGPDVDGSRWFCEQFNEAGIPAGHIDADEIIIGTEVLSNDEDSRKRLVESLISGALKIICNRFILREGIDIPQVGHMIFATTFGSLTSYLQAGGRGLRSCPSIGKKNCIVQDHGGNWHRHGSLNADRLWELNQSDIRLVKDREERMREKAATGENEPIVCPHCAAVRMSGNQCGQCGKITSGKSRVVVQVDGQLREVRGDVYKPRVVSQDPADVKLWKQVYWRCRNSGKNFNQAAGLFFKECGKWPNKSWPLMPLPESAESTKYRHIKDVPMSELHPDTPTITKPIDPPANLFGGAA